jgi:hypothetical protein
MPYRFYILDRTGGYMDVVEALCAGDEEALRSAREVGRGTAIEVWQQGRFVSKLDRRAAA